jgi:hypothetical protein
MFLVNLHKSPRVDICHLDLYTKYVIYSRNVVQSKRHPLCPDQITNMSTLLSLISKPSSFTSPTAIVLPSSLPTQPNARRNLQIPQYDQEELSYSDLRSLVLSFRKILIEDLGVNTGEVVALSMANTVEFMIAFVGTTVSRYVKS